MINPPIIVGKILIIIQNVMIIQIYMQIFYLTAGPTNWFYN
jgi:hypothetical protein